ncbi:MAG: hypothetical protein ACI31R_02860 [Bacilli bacterium]
MNKIIKEVRDKLEMEKSNSKRFLLSNLYVTLFNLLDEKEKQEEFEYAYNIDLILETDSYYDYLKNDGEIFKNFASKADNRYKKTNFNYYFLCPENKIKFDEAKEIIFEILKDAKIDNIEKLYDFDKIKYKNLEDCDGYCINTFGMFQDNIVLNKDIEKMVIFIKDLVHEIGHNYENLFMSNMSSIQQVERYAYCFVEVCSCFFERLALDYLIKNRIYTDDANRELNNYYCDLYDRLTFLGNVSTNENLENAIYDAESVLCVSENEFSNALESNEKVIFYKHNYIDDIKYGYGSLLGEYFFDIYKQDKKEGLKRLRNFLSNQGLLDERQMLDTIEFKENDFSFLDKGLSDNTKYMRKRYKW